MGLPPSLQPLAAAPLAEAGQQPTDHGFVWVAEGWRLGPAPMPTWLGPVSRGRCFERDGTYRFSALVAHPWLGVMAAYAGRLVPLAD